MLNVWAAFRFRVNRMREVAVESTTFKQPESSGVLRMDHSLKGVDQESRIYDMRRQQDRESFVKFASWASRNSVTFTCKPL